MKERYPLVDKIARSTVTTPTDKIADEIDNAA